MISASTSPVMDFPVQDLVVTVSEALRLIPIELNDFELALNRCAQYDIEANLSGGLIRSPGKDGGVK